MFSQIPEVEGYLGVLSVRPGLDVMSVLMGRPVGELSYEEMELICMVVCIYIDKMYSECASRLEMVLDRLLHELVRAPPLYIAIIKLLQNSFPTLPTMPSAHAPYDVADL